MHDSEVFLHDCAIYEKVEPLVGHQRRDQYWDSTSFSGINDDLQTIGFSIASYLLHPFCTNLFC